MNARPSEVREPHTRLLRTGLLVEESRAYLAQPGAGAAGGQSEQAMAEYWFGMRGEQRVKSLLAAMEDRFDRYPAALAVLRRWPEMDPEERALICHWHLQLSDPIYRDFSGKYLVERREGPRPEVRSEAIAGWLERAHPERWGLATRLRWASALLTAASRAGLVGEARDARPLLAPRVPERALGYALHLLRGLAFSGEILANPYLASVGLSGGALEERLRRLPGVTFRRMGHLVELEWTYPDLGAWAEATL